MTKKEFIKLLKNIPADAEIRFQANGSRYYYVESVDSLSSVVPDQEWDEEAQESAGPVKALEVETTHTIIFC